MKTQPTATSLLPDDSQTHIDRKTHDLMDELNLLDPAQVQLFMDEFDELQIAIEGQDPIGPVSVHRAFPLSAAGDYIALRGPDDEELGIVQRTADLEEQSQQALNTETERTYFVAQITAIRSIKTEYYVPHWDVETDRGPRIFQLHSARRDLRIMAGGRILLHDADGNRYEIPNYQNLSPESRALIEVLI
jgi:hypothetical protein